MGVGTGRWVDKTENMFLNKSENCPITSPRCPQGSSKWRFPDYVTMTQDGGKVVSLTHRPFLPTGNTPGTMSMKNSNTTAGIEPATFWFVSQHLNHCDVLLYVTKSYICYLTLILLTWRIWWAPNNASRWQVVFNLAFKELNSVVFPGLD